MQLGYFSKVPGRSFESFGGMLIGHKWPTRRSKPKSHWLRPHRGISQEKLPLYLGFFEFVHNVQNRGKALLCALIELLVIRPRNPIRAFVKQEGCHDSPVFTEARRDRPRGCRPLCPSSDRTHRREPRCNDLPKQREQQQWRRQRPLCRHERRGFPATRLDRL